MISRYFSALLSAMLLAAAVGLAGCASPVDPASYANEKPTLDLSQYFDGKLDAWGVVTDRSGKVVRRFTVALNGTWKMVGDVKTGTLEEDFVYSDGKKERRVWTIKKLPNGK